MRPAFVRQSIGDAHALNQQTPTPVHTPIIRTSLRIYPSLRRRTVFKGRFSLPARPRPERMTRIRLSARAVWQPPPPQPIDSDAKRETYFITNDFTHTCLITRYVHRMLCSRARAVIRDYSLRHKTLFVRTTRNVYTCARNVRRVIDPSSSLKRDFLEKWTREISGSLRLFYERLYVCMRPYVYVSRRSRAILICS